MRQAGYNNLQCFVYNIIPLIVTREIRFRSLIKKYSRHLYSSKPVWFSFTMMVVVTFSRMPRGLRGRFDGSFSRLCTRSGVLRTQKLRCPLSCEPSATNVLPLKPGVGQNIAMHASPTTRNFFLVLISTFSVRLSSFLFKSSPKWDCLDETNPSMEKTF